MESDSRLKPVSKFHFYRRKLPHFELPGNVYFITFTVVEGLTLSDEAKDIVLESVKFGDGTKYKLFACVVMNTHVHFIVQPLEERMGSVYSLAQIMHSIKSFTANRIQRLSGKTGQVWLNESYDRAIRHGDEYLDKLNYLINNPLKAGIVEKPEDYRWLYVIESDEA